MDPLKMKVSPCHLMSPLTILLHVSLCEFPLPLTQSIMYFCPLQPLICAIFPRSDAMVTISFSQLILVWVVTIRGGLLFGKPTDIHNIQAIQLGLGLWSHFYVARQTPDYGGSNTHSLPPHMFICFPCICGSLILLRAFDSAATVSRSAADQWFIMYRRSGKSRC